MTAMLVVFALAFGAGETNAAALTQNRAADLRTTLTGAGRAPRAGKPWRFVVRAVDGAGRAIPATVQVRVVLAGRPVDTIGFFRFSGTLRRSYRWPATLAGAWTALEATILAEGTQRTVRYAVRVVAETGEPRFRAFLDADSRSPRVGAPWHFVVRARDQNGGPVGGTAIVRVVVAGRIVDTVGWFGFHRRLRRPYLWSPRLRGAFALLQATVVGPGGTRTVGYGVRVE